MDSKTSTPITPPTPPKSEPSTPSITQSLGKKRRQLGWAPPTLNIPSPQPYTNNPQYTANISMHGMTPSPNANPYIYPRKASAYMFSQFNGIRDFTMNTAKSGLGIGEKCSFWMYNQLSKLSKRWFTHIFLTIVIVIYTVGGALVFVTIEGSHEDKLVLIDMRTKRRILLEELRNLSIEMPKETSLGEWHGEATRRLEDFEKYVIETYDTHKLIKAQGTKQWTFWNSVFYCSTIYTTIESMDSSHASTENVNKTDDGKNTENEMSISKLESMVTAEQVLSASVARKRRNITKRRSSAGKTRELTPARQLIDRTSTDEEAPQTRPKTPERRRRKVTKSNVSNPTNDVKNDASTQPENKTCAPVTDVTIQNGRKKADKRDSLVSISQAELLALFDKAKRKIVSSRDRYKKSGALPRSQSSPRQLTEEELLESFKRAQLITAEREKQRKRSHSARKYSTDSCKSTSSSEIIVFKPLRPIVQEFVAQRKLAKNHTFANKIVEILDPKTSKVIHTQEVLHVRFKFFDFVKVLRHFTIFELCREFQKFKSDRTDEWNKIKILRMRCLNELLMIMVVCGLGGVMFKFVEGTFENFYKCGVKRVKRDFIDNLWTKSHNLREEDWKSLARTKLRVFEEELHNAHEAGIHSYSGQRSWSFLNGVVYSLTVITTIGYGHLFPTTTTGQGLTIVYALIGIPLFLIILTDFGKLFTRCIKFVWSFVRRIYYTGSCRRARKTTHVGDIFKGAQIMYDIATMRRPSVFNPDPNPEEPSTQPEQEEVSPITPAPSNYEINDEFNLPITLALSILVLYIFLGAVAFQIMEGWDFFTSFYFVFISMSTIGFGDYVPRRHPTFMLVSIAYLVFGLALMSMCINVVQDKLSNTFKHASAKIGATIGLTVNEEDGSIITVPPDTVEMPEIHNVEVTNEVS